MELVHLKDVPFGLSNNIYFGISYIYQPPPIGQDMTQGQFLSGV